MTRHLSRSVYFSTTFLSELRSRIDLVVVIGKRVQLFRRGRRYIALCPFHKEKTPSFSLDQEKGLYHCFGCGEHGDAISFVMRMDGLSFVEAVEQLGVTVGLELPKSQLAPDTKYCTTLLEVLQAATSFYKRQLYRPVGMAALEYLYGRGLDDSIIARFQIGFAPESNACKAVLLREGISEALMIDAGLLSCSRNTNQSYDIFRNRIMFPITNRKGHILAFGGRVLGYEKPKYLNSPDTILFRKRQVLYGIEHAYNPSLGKGSIIVAEGYMDTIALVHAGFSHTVASLGTSLTLEQINTLWRIAAEPILCFDGDIAGYHSVKRIADQVLPLLKPGKSLRFSLLPKDRDPADVLQTDGIAAMNRILEKAVPLFELVWKKLLEGKQLDTPEQRAAFEQEITVCSNRIVDTTVRHYYIRALHAKYREKLDLISYSTRTYKNTRKTRYNFSVKNTKPHMVALANKVLMTFLLTYPDILHRHIEEAIEALSTSRELKEALELIANKLIKQPTSQQTDLDLEDTFKKSGLQNYLTIESSRQQINPETDYQRMLVAIHDQALICEIRSLQLSLAREWTLNTWQRLQALLKERYLIQTSVPES